MRSEGSLLARTWHSMAVCNELPLLREVREKLPKGLEVG